MMLSDHAIDRYRRRWAPSLSWDDAADQLRALANVAKPVPGRHRGNPLYATGAVRMAVTRNTTGRGLLVVTVLDRDKAIDVAAELEPFLDDEDRARTLAAPAASALGEARDKYAEAGQWIHIAETLIADGKAMLADADRLRFEARARVLRLQDDTTPEDAR